MISCKRLLPVGMLVSCLKILSGAITSSKSFFFSETRNRAELTHEHAGPPHNRLEVGMSLSGEHAVLGTVDQALLLEYKA